MRALPLVLASLSLLLPLSACKPPGNAAVVKCTGEFTLSRPRRDCSLAIAELEGSAGKTFEGENRHRYARFTGDFTVKRGTVKVLLRGSGEFREYVLTPQAPLHIEDELRLHLNRRSFVISFQSGSASGIEGELSYTLFSGKP